MGWLIKTIVAALISFLVPWFLKRVLPGPASSVETVSSDSKGFPWFGWIAGLAVAGGLAGIVSGAMGLVLGGVANWAIFIFVQPIGHPTWAAVGLVVGLLQWLSLLGKVKGAFWWVPAN